jgi:hypothetical protein
VPLLQFALLHLLFPSLSHRVDFVYSCDELFFKKGSAHFSFCLLQSSTLYNNNEDFGRNIVKMPFEILWTLLWCTPCRSSILFQCYSHNHLVSMFTVLKFPR